MADAPSMVQVWGSAHEKEALWVLMSHLHWLHLSIEEGRTEIPPKNGRVPKMGAASAQAAGTSASKK